MLHDINNRWKEDDTISPYSPPKQEYIRAEANKILKAVKSYCDVSGIDFSRIEYDVPALKDIILRMDMRFLYFKIYHNDMEINEYKLICGLIVFWLLKLRPFYIKISSDDSAEIINLATNVNENIALHIAVGLLKEYNPRFFSSGKDLVGHYLKELLYSFRYRDLSKESLFLMFDPFYFLHLFEFSVDEIGKNKV